MGPWNKSEDDRGLVVRAPPHVVIAGFFPANHVCSTDGVELWVLGINPRMTEVWLCALPLIVIAGFIPANHLSGTVGAERWVLGINPRMTMLGECGSFLSW
jgi:hypothetical protein